MERFELLLPWIAAAVILFLLVKATMRAVVRARPDEWLLVIREGVLERAGVGIWALSLPNRSVVRFTSTLQRVCFTAEALSAEHLGVAIEGFILWTVEHEGDGPFRAFQNLGIHDLQSAGERTQLKSPKHLLGAAQHHAFQAMLAAEVQRYAGTVPIERLMSEQDALVAALMARLVPLTEGIGVRIAQLQLLRVRPTEASILAEHAKREELAAAARIDRMRIDAEREKVEQEVERKRVALAFEVERTQRTAQAKADAIAMVAEAEEKKSQAVRDYQLAEALAEQVTKAVSSLPIKEAHWTTISNDSPIGTVGRLVAELRDSLKH